MVQGEFSAPAVQCEFTRELERLRTKAWFVICIPIVAISWNNRCGDAVLRNAQSQWIDWAEYDPKPPEGVVLNRVIGTNTQTDYKVATGTYGR